MRLSELPRFVQTRAAVLGIIVLVSAVPGVALGLVLARSGSEAVAPASESRVQAQNAPSIPPVAEAAPLVDPSTEAVPAPVVPRRSSPPSARPSVPRPAPVAVEPVCTDEEKARIRAAAESARAGV